MAAARLAWSELAASAINAIPGTAANGNQVHVTFERCDLTLGEAGADPSR
jgi:hypothetical protein